MFQKLERDSSKGYQMLNLGSHWEFHSSRGIFSGDLKKVVVYAVNQLGFQFKELEVAVEEMEKQFHNGAEFGMYRSFMFTFEKELSNALHIVHIVH